MGSNGVEKTADEIGLKVFGHGYEYIKIFG